MRIRKKTRGSIIVAIFFMVICSFMAFAYLTLIPMEATTTRDSERRQIGSMSAEAGVAEAIIFLEEGGKVTKYPKATPLVSQGSDLASKWQYQVFLEQLPNEIVQVTSRARSYDKTWLQARAFVRNTNDVFFRDQMRSMTGMVLPAGMTAEYFGTVHSNDKFKIEYGNGYASGSTFHDKATWSNTSQTAPEVAGKSNIKWTKVSSLNKDDNSWAPGFEGPVPKRSMPDLNPDSPKNLFTGANETKNFLKLTLNGGVKPSGGGVTAIPDGGIFVDGDADLSLVEFSLLNEPDPTKPKVAPFFDNDPATHTMWKNKTGFDPSKTNAQNSAGLTQMVTFKYTNGKTYNVVFDEANKQTTVHKPDGTKQVVTGLSSEQIWIDDSVKVQDVQGPNKGNKVISAYQVEILMKNTGTPPFRADVEPARVAGGFGPQSYKPFTDANETRDGFTFAARDSFKIINTGDKMTFAGDNSNKFAFMYYNVLAWKEIAFDISPQSNFDFLVGGALYSNNEIKMYQTNNDSFKFAMDPGNTTLAGQDGDPDYSIIHYEEDFYRAGEKD